MAAPPPVPSAAQTADLGRAGLTVAEGADRARSAGLEARTVTRGGPGEIARAIFDVADEYGGDFVVVALRPASRLESALLGSVCASAVREERRPVLVVPGPPE